MDAALHAERLAVERAVRPLASLPDGAMVENGGDAYLWARGSLWRWSFAAYGPPETPPSGKVAVLTPPSIVAALAGGYRPRAEGTPLS